MRAQALVADDLVHAKYLRCDFVTAQLGDVRITSLLIESSQVLGTSTFAGALGLVYNIGQPSI